MENQRPSRSAHFTLACFLFLSLFGQQGGQWATSSSSTLLEEMHCRVIEF
jgi:hypothetical protein